MTLILLDPSPRPSPQQIISGLSAEHGRLRVLLIALIAALSRPRRTRALQADTLSNHLRRDIGLSAQTPVTRMRWPMI